MAGSHSSHPGCGRGGVKERDSAGNRIASSCIGLGCQRELIVSRIQKQQWKRRAWGWCSPGTPFCSRDRRPVLWALPACLGPPEPKLPPRGGTPTTGCTSICHAWSGEASVASPSKNPQALLSVPRLLPVRAPQGSSTKTQGRTSDCPM